jgi:protein subunit release factor A
MLDSMKIKVVAGVLLVFFVGMLLGALGTTAFVFRKMRQFAEGSANMRHIWFMRRLARQLDLTEEQKTEAQHILTDSDQEIQQLVRHSLLEFSNIMERQKEALKTVLTPEQQEELEKHFGRIRSHWLPKHPPDE